MVALRFFSGFRLFIYTLYCWDGLHFHLLFSPLLLLLLLPSFDGVFVRGLAVVFFASSGVRLFFCMMACCGLLRFF
jgi:hypothetical protein